MQKHELKITMEIRATPASVADAQSIGRWGGQGYDSHEGRSHIHAVSRLHQETRAESRSRELHGGSSV
jgi:hypothetical protein